MANPDGVAWLELPAWIYNTDDANKADFENFWEGWRNRGFHGIQTISAALAGRPLVVGPDGTVLGFDNPLNFGLKSVQGGLVKFVDFTDATLTISSANQAAYAGVFLRCNRATAQTLTIASTVSEGFFLTWCQVGAGQLTVAGSGLTLANALGHSKSLGQHAIGTLVRNDVLLRFAGQTAA